MKSRERVLASIKHIEPEKVPFYLGSNPSSGISAIAYSNLIKHFGKRTFTGSGLRRGSATGSATR